MKHIYLLFLFILVTATSCTSQEESPQLIEGTYVGEFDREGLTSTVELKFLNQEFSGKSDSKHFPAIGFGTYTLSSNSIDFKNLSVWTADFDWTLVLVGKWQYTFENKRLILTYENGDKYTLQKQ